MPEQQLEVTPENLEEVENQLAGFQKIQGEPPKADSEPAPETVQSATPATPPSQAPAEDFSKYLAETPFKNIDEVVKGWKNAVGEMTRKNQKVKPYEPILNQADTDPEYAQYLQKAHQQYLAYKANPQAFQPQSQPQQAYDLYTPEGQAQFRQDMALQTQQQVEMVRMQYQQEIAKVQEQARFENMRAAFKAKFPDEDPDKLQEFWQEAVSQLTPYEIALRVRNFDKVQTDATSKARQEVNKQLETAQKTKTPASSPPAQAAKVEDILAHVGKYGAEAAFKRFGEGETMKAIEDAENTLSTR